MKIMLERGEVITIFSRLSDYINSVDKNWKENIKSTINAKIETVINSTFSPLKQMALHEKL